MPTLAPMATAAMSSAAIWADASDGGGLGVDVMLSISIPMTALVLNWFESLRAWPKGDLLTGGFRFGQNTSSSH